MSTGWVVLALLLSTLVALWLYGLAHRLDRLHVRTDSAWLALEAALGRRAAVVRVAVSTYERPGSEIAVLADRAERAPRREREAAENTLSTALVRRRAGASTPVLAPELAAELADAEARVQIARRFYNDAVRDTLALGCRRPVRWLHLGGTATLPAYFEIAERTPPRPAPRARPAARVVLLDRGGRVLLMRAQSTDDPGEHFWFTAGGGIEAGESPRAAAVREVTEETGLVLSEQELHGPLWLRQAVMRFDGEQIEAQETYFAARVDEFRPHGAGLTEIERRTMAGARWCSGSDIAGLEAGGERVYPPGLAQLLAEAHRAVEQPLDVVGVRTIR